MRDINRIDKFCARLAKAWKMFPDQRFGQLMCNILGDMQSNGRDPFFPEEILAKCKETVKLLGDTCMNVSTAGSIVMYDRAEKRGI